jgi:adenosine/AMP kinase
MQPLKKMCPSMESSLGRTRGLSLGVVFFTSPRKVEGEEHLQQRKDFSRNPDVDFV